MAADADPGERILANPFLVLGLDAKATAVQIEREGQKILGMLELGLNAAGSYEYPFGRRSRTVDLVRWAMAELRDPRRRLLHELWLTGTSAVSLPDSQGVNAWRGARTAFGWARR